MREGSAHQEDVSETQGVFNGRGTHSADVVEDAGAGTLEELRQTLESLTRTIERRAARVSARTRSSMRENPWMTVGIASLVGAAIAVIALPARSGSARPRHLLPRLGDMEMPRISMPSVPVHAPRLPSRKTLAQYAEQAADAITRVDPNAFSSQRFAGLGDVLRAAWEKLTAQK